MNFSPSRFAFLALAAVTSAHVLASSNSPLDQPFVTQAFQGGLAEVALGKVGETKGTEAAVKVFGQTMVIEHGNANTQLNELAAAKGLIVPDAPSPADQAATAQIAGLSSDAFNARYAGKMIADHKKTIALFEQEGRAGHDPELKAFAAEHLPGLRHHLAMAEQLPGAKSP